MEWLVARTEVRRELAAAELFAENGAQAYCPVIMSQAHVRGRIVDRPLAMFPGYLFVEAVPAALTALRSRSLAALKAGRVNLLPSHREPRRVASGVVDRIRLLETEISHQRVSLALLEPIRAGTKVQVGDSGLEGVVVRCRGSVVTVLTKFFDSVREAQVPLGHVWIAETAAGR